MYKLVISDLDGTLLNEKHELSEYTKEIVKKLIDKGIIFFIATGRHHMDAVETKRKLGLEKAYLITNNGGRVHDYEGNLLISHNHKRDVAEEVLKLELDKNIHINVFTEDKWIIFEDNKVIEEWSSNSSFKYIKGKMEDIDFDAIIKWYYLGEHDLLVELKSRLEEKWKDEIECIFSLEDCLEIMPKGVSKGKAIEEILSIENISRETTMAFGDGFNDLEMLEVVQKGLVMGNAHIKLKNALPNHEVIDTNKNNGVANYLKDFFSL